MDKAENRALDIDSFISNQLNQWPAARQSYDALSGVKLKEVVADNVTYKVQFNPARITSSSAKVDARSIESRPCFLCAAHRPAEQLSLPFGNDYEILLNPYPIFHRHLTIACKRHVPQCIRHRFAHLLDLARALPDFTLFYNGAHCGASAPDHQHFQAGERGFMPIEQQWQTLSRDREATLGSATLSLLTADPRSALVLEGTEASDLVRLFELLYQHLPHPEGDEPMLNLLAYHEGEKWVVLLFPRIKHRPACYYAEGSERLLCSPASVDLGGVFITPLARDFERLDGWQIAQIISEVCLPPAEAERICRSVRTHIDTSAASVARSDIS